MFEKQSTHSFWALHEISGLTPCLQNVGLGIDTDPKAVEIAKGRLMM
jgi:hypothetical protein